MKQSRWTVSASLCLVAALLMGAAHSFATDQKKPAPAAKPAPAPAARPAAPQSKVAGGTTGARPGQPSGPAGPSPNHGPSANQRGPTTNERPTLGHPNVAPSTKDKPEAERPSLRSTTQGHVSTERALHAARVFPGRDATLKGGGNVHFRPNGRVSEIHDPARHMDVHHGLDGSRRVIVERTDHSRIYAERGRPGFVERPYMYHGRDFARRTYYYNGRAYDRYYRGYAYRGAYLHVYTPMRYYPVGFYGWVYHPWYQPVPYTWGWAGNPWYGYYGAYFSPYPVYPGAAFWLTDYMLAANLQADYQSRQQNQAQSTQLESGPTELTPEVKQQIADEVRNQITLENSEAQQNSARQDSDPGSSGIARMLTDGQAHVFVVANSLDVVDSTNTECSLTGGDVLGMKTAPASDATAAELVVMASKSGQECAKNATVTVALNDLQEMQNHMRETIDQGLEEMQSKNGKGGLPQAPASALVSPSTAEFAQIAPPPNPGDAADINRQLTEADAAEHEATSQVQPDSTSPNSAAQPESYAPPTVEVGQTVEQVTALLGQPQHAFDVGPKKILQYPGLKVTFKDGKVVDVQ